MASFPRDFERFLSRVLHRYIALRLLEQFGLGILFGCAAGFFLFVIAILRSVPPTPLIAGAIALGAALGLLHGLLTRPRLHDAAAESDRQLDTADLLTTALSMRNSPDPWAGAVLATANNWSRTVSPSSVLLNRLGARAWGGIGLATALLGTLTLLPTYASRTEAAHQAPSQVASTSDHPNPLRQATSAGRRAIPDQQPEDLRPNPTTSTNDAAPASIRDPQLVNRNSPSAPNGQGHSESHTAAQAQPAPSSSDPTRSRNTSPQGRDASGTGQSAPNASRGNSNSSQSTGLQPPLTPTPPWKSADWNSHAQQALHSVDSGQVPDTYRDVIHGYFDHP